MKRSVWGVLIAVSVLGLSALGGCGKASSPPALGGETHWLEHCDGGFDCGPGLECLCGVCTTACTDDASCSADGAVCAERAATTYADGCQSAAPERLCVASSDVVLPTVAAPAPDRAECGDRLFSTDVGCLTCSDVRKDLQILRDELEAQYSSGPCSRNEDCVIVPVGSDCDESCPAAVNRQNLAAYNRDMAVLDQSYCKAPDEWRDQCGVHTPYCRDLQAYCNIFAGQCFAADNLPSCYGRPLDQCEDDGCFVASGTVYDPTNRCFSAQPVAISCVPRGFTCPDEPTAALDVEGNCYFLGECIPTGYQGFQEAPPDHPCSAALSTTCAN